MKQRNAPARLICCLSVVGLSLAACSHKATNVKPNVPPQVETQPSAAVTEGSASRLFHYSHKGLRQVKIKDTRSTKRIQYEYANLWERLFDSYSLPDVRNQAVEREVSWFVNHPTYLQRAQQRAEPFLYNIVQQIERQSVPGELALLPVVESAFQAQAVSPAKAAGIWQFIPATGRHYGLRQNHAYDGRRDVYASTKAAIKYLKKLNRQFNGDWLLAIAAYNCGEGAVERAIQRNLYNGLATDFWSLDLPQETRSYVPRLLAVSRLMADADQYGVDLRHIPNQAQYKPVKISQQLDLAMAADAADMSLEQFRALNPGFKNTFVDPEGSVRLFVPASKSKTFKKELARLASVQSDLLRREFERNRDGADEFAGTRPEPIASLSESTRPPSAGLPASSEWRREVSTTSASSVPVAERARPSTSRSETAEPMTTAYTTESSYPGSDNSPDPFQTPRVTEETDFPAPEEPRHTRYKKGHYQSLSSRSAPNHRTVRASEVKKNMGAGATRELDGPEHLHGSKRSPKPAVSYRYSEQPSRSKGVASKHQPANRNTAGSAKMASADGKADRKPGKLTVALAGSPSMARSSQASKLKTRETSAAAPSPSSRSSRTSGGEPRKNERIITAKAEVAKVKTRR